MGTAFLAVADDPSAILHNPGGIASNCGSRDITTPPNLNFKLAQNEREDTKGVDRAARQLKRRVEWVKD